MDDSRFDAVARAVSAAATRRQALRILIGAIAGWRSPERLVASAGPQGDACGPGLTLCTSDTAILGCFDLSSDPANCGGCGAVCESGLVATQCSGGQCVRAGCPAALTDCGAAGCVDLSSDPNNCGFCGFGCVGGPCVDGECPPLPQCDGGLTYCGTFGCVDVYSDPNNCGGCGAACESGLVAVECRGGQCVRADCGPGLTYCGAVDLCRDLSSDPFACGACGNVCASGSCAGGSCVPLSLCDPGFTYCGEVAGCVDTSSNRNHCGGCGLVCPGIGGLVCAGGRCGCPPGWTDCSQAPGAPQGIEGYCADLGRDPRNCGACGNGCPSGVCGGGRCAPSQPSCPSGQSICAGRCVTLSTDPRNCGACGSVCARGASCVSGDCICRPGLSYCPDLLACLDLAADPVNCGRCGRACPSGVTCRAGVCQVQTTSQHQPAGLIGWPFDPGAGRWAIVNGYRGQAEHAPPPDGGANFALFGLDFALCPPDRIDERGGVCRLGEPDDNEIGWDVEGTRGAEVRSPVDGAVAWTDRSVPTCPGLAIDVDGAPGYRLALFPIEGSPERGRVERGKPIGRVAAKGCADGDAIHMILYRPRDASADDPEEGRTAVPFDGKWAISRCSFPDDGRSRNLYRGLLATCRADESAAGGA